MSENIGHTLQSGKLQTARKIRVVVVDDSSFIRRFAQREFEKEGYDITTFEDGASAVAAVKESVPDLLLTDLNMEGMTGFDVLEQLKIPFPRLPIIMLTGSEELSDALHSIRSGAFDYVTKPIDRKNLFDVVKRALRIAELEEQNRLYTAELAARDEKMRSELEMARRLQSALLPTSVPVVPGLEFGLHFTPSGEIGGDFYDFYEYVDRPLVGVIFVDISGHGIPAALLMTMFKTLASQVFPVMKTPVEAMSLLNRLVASTFPENNFASTLFALFNKENRVMTLVKASQEPVIVFRKGEEPQLIETGGPLLGAFDPEIFGDPDYSETNIELKSGDTVLFYTDGLVEVENPAGELLRYEGLLPWLHELLPRSPQEIVDELYKRARAYAGDLDLGDDFTILAVRAL